MDDNAEEIKLLREDPGALLLRYQPLIETIVKVNIASGNIHFSEKDDLVQFINEAFLRKIPQIRKHYGGQSLLKTYCTAVVYNILQERLRQHSRHDKEILVEEFDGRAHYPEQQFNRLVVEQEMERFEKILKLFNQQRAKLELFLKLYFRIPVTLDDFKRYHPGIAMSIVDAVSKEVRMERELKDKEIYEIIAMVSMDARDKHASGEAVRKWLRNRVEEIIVLLNGKYHKRSHNRETLQILAEMYYERKDDLNDQLI